MSQMVKVRNVPDDVHRELKIRATRRGQTLSDFLLEELERLVRRPTLEDVLDRIRAREAVPLEEPPARAVRAERDSRR